jgi:hypothetical protein
MSEQKPHPLHDENELALQQEAELLGLGPLFIPTEPDAELLGLAPFHLFESPAVERKPVSKQEPPEKTG